MLKFFDHSIIYGIVGFRSMNLQKANLSLKVYFNSLVVNPVQL